MKRLLIALFALLPLPGQAQLVPIGQPKLLDPTKWKVAFSKQEVKAGDKVDIIISVSIDDGWYLYALGEQPHTSIEFVEHPSFKLSGKIRPSGGIKEKHDDLTDMNVKYYDKKAEFIQTVIIQSPEPEIMIEVRGQTCSHESNSDGEAACVLVRKDLDAGKIKVTASDKSKAPVPAEKDKTTEVKENKGQSVEKQAGASADRIKALEEEREKLTSRTPEGKDESIEYLKGFVNKHGGKK